MKKKIMVVVILWGVILSGCGNGSSKNILTETGSDARNEIQKETPISEVLNKKGRQIWYSVSDPDKGKDSHFSVFTVEDGKIANSTNRSIDHSDELKFGDIAKMTDDEVYNDYLPKYYHEEHLKKFTLNIETDASGNSTDIEVLRGAMITFVGGYAKIQVYDQWFSGLKTKTGAYFVMRDPDKKGELSFVLDQPGAKGVTVDE